MDRAFVKKLIIKTLGCKVNQAESDQMAAELDAVARDQFEWQLSDDRGHADVCIINTCTVTQKAAMQSRQAIRQAVRNNPNARVIVTGCYAQMDPEAILEIEGVADVVDNRQKNRLTDLILPGASEQRKAIDLLPIIKGKGRSRPVLKIQDGCNAFCSYCIVPYARGRNRSMAPDEVTRHVSALSRAGYKEVVLSGIHLGAYGLDLDCRLLLSRLVGNLIETSAIPRLRLSSIEPKELDEELIALAAAGSRPHGQNRSYLCNHFHIPLQSGDDDILAKMKRPYDTAFFTRLLHSIDNTVADVAIGLDVLVGFPGESAAAFDRTYELVENAPVGYLHVFPFSAREGTPAYAMTDQIDSATIKERCRRLRELGQSKKNRFYRRQVGKIVQVLVESRRDRQTGLLKGISSNYIPVFINGPDTLKECLVNVRLHEMTPQGLQGRLI